MLQEKHHQLLNQLRFGQSFSERKNALISLKALEDSGLTKEVDIKALLNENDSVTRNYAIGAAGRLKIDDLKSKLINDFVKSFDPLILISFIEAFISYNQADFVKWFPQLTLCKSNNFQTVFFTNFFCAGKPFHSAIVFFYIHR